VSRQSINGNSNGVTGSNGSVTENAIHVHRNGTLHENGNLQDIMPQLFVLSAASEKSLLASAVNLKDWLHSHKIDDHILKNLSYTLSVHRSQLPWRCSFVASNADELSADLGQVTSRKTRSSSSVSLIFILTGQGAQWHAMGRELIASSRCFNESIKKSDDLLRKYGCSWSLVDELSRDKAESRVGESEISQPATTAIQIALVDLLARFNIAPTSVLGHSSGEIGGAYVAGALNHESAILV
jgi:acyl transferase domain-containing protein